jgi:alanine-synthesizing transaminase
VNPGEDMFSRPSPDYPLYSAVLCKLGIALNAYDLNEDDAWQPELADIERKLTPRTRGIVLINPNNPTGSLCTRQMLGANRGTGAPPQPDRLLGRNLRQIDSRRHAASSPSPRSRPTCLACITFGGMSKNYLVPGWRIGWGIVSGEAAAVKPYTEGVHRLCARASAPTIPSSTPSGPRSKARRIISSKCSASCAPAAISRRNGARPRRA